MTALAIVLAILIVIGLTPVGARVGYDDGALTVQLGLGPLKMMIFPPKIKKIKRKTAAKTRGNKANKKKKERPKVRFSDIQPFLGPALELVASLPRKLLVRELTVRATFGGGDAASTAIHYGQAWAAIGMVTPVLENAFRIQKRDVGAYLDYELDRVAIFVALDIRMRIATGFFLGVKTAARLLKILLQEKKAVQV